MVIVGEDGESDGGAVFAGLKVLVVLVAADPDDGCDLGVECGEPGVEVGGGAGFGKKGSVWVEGAGCSTGCGVAQGLLEEEALGVLDGFRGSDGCGSGAHDSR